MGADRKLPILRNRNGTDSDFWKRSLPNLKYFSPNTVQSQVADRRMQCLIVLSRTKIQVPWQSEAVRNKDFDAFLYIVENS